MNFSQLFPVRISRCGRPNDDTAGPTTTRPAQRRHRRPNDDTAGPTTTRPAQRRHGRPNDDTAGPTTTPPAQRRHGRPNDDTAGPTTTPAAQRRHGRPNDDTAGPTTRFPNKEIYHARQKLLIICGTRGTLNGFGVQNNVKLSIFKSFEQHES